MFRLAGLPDVLLVYVMDFLGSLRQLAILCRQLRTCANEHRHLVLREFFETEFDFACLGRVGDLDRCSPRLERLWGDRGELRDLAFFWYKLQICLMRYVEKCRGRVTTPKVLFDSFKSHHCSRAQYFPSEDLWPPPNSLLLTREIRREHFWHLGLVRTRDLGCPALAKTIGEVVGTIVLLIADSERDDEDTYCNWWCGGDCNGRKCPKFFYGR